MVFTISVPYLTKTWGFIFFNSCNRLLAVLDSFSIIWNDHRNGTTKFMYHCCYYLQVQLPKTLLQCYRPKYFTKLFWGSKCLRGILKMSGKQVGNNHKRRTCVCGSLLSKALLHFRLTFTIHRQWEQLCNEG